MDKQASLLHKSLSLGGFLLHCSIWNSTLVSWLLTLPKNIRLRQNCMKETNMRTFYTKVSIWGIFLKHCSIWHSTLLSKLLTLPRNNKLGWKFTKVTNTLAYYTKVSIWVIYKAMFHLEFYLSEYTTNLAQKY
jgi:hypothetical protein